MIMLQHERELQWDGRLRSSSTVKARRQFSGKQYPSAKSLMTALSRSAYTRSLTVGDFVDQMVEPFGIFWTSRDVALTPAVVGGE
jgi:hypothetical protein